MFDYTDTDGNMQSVDIDIEQVLTLRWGDNAPVPWNDQDGTVGLYAHEVFSNVSQVIMIMRAVRGSAEYESAAEAWLVTHGHNVNQKNKKRLGVGINKKKKTTNNPMNKRHVIHGEIISNTEVTDDTPGEIIIRVHPEIPRQPKKTRKELEIEVAELRAQLDMNAEQVT